MPKLSQEALEARRGRIEEAARELFISRGFHATSMRDIAQRAATSLGNLYNYYPTKEDILESIIARYQKVIDARLRAIFDEVEEPFHPESLRRFGRMVRELVSGRLALGKQKRTFVFNRVGRPAPTLFSRKLSQEVSKDVFP